MLYFCNQYKMYDQPCRTISTFDSSADHLCEVTSNSLPLKVHELPKRVKSPFHTIPVPYTSKLPIAIAVTAGIVSENTA